MVKQTVKQAFILCVNSDFEAKFMTLVNPA